MSDEMIQTEAAVSELPEDLPAEEPAAEAAAPVIVDTHAAAVQALGQVEPAAAAGEETPAAAEAAGEKTPEAAEAAETSAPSAEPQTADAPEDAPAEEPSEAPAPAPVDYGPVLARYPRFNPETDGADPQFAAMVAAGVATDKAYEVLHLDDLLLGAMEYAARRTLERLAGSALAGEARPRENGLAAGQPAQTALDPRTMTRQQFKDLKERVYRGEKVYL